ncbi:MAG: IS1595 family transposase [Candidatus Sulfotelmatobacter sp.]
MATASEPKTLQQAMVYFADPDNCLSFLVARRFREGVFCPRCGSKEVSFLSTRRLWECKSKHPKRQFSIKVNTIFEDSPISLEKWLVAVWMIANCKNGVSSYEIHRAIGVTQKSAWFMMHRIRLALKVGSFHKLGGGPENEVEVDETFIGGKLRNMHKDKKVIYNKRGGAFGKTVVMGILDRGRGEVRAKVVADTKRDSLVPNIAKQVKYGSTVYTDEAVQYQDLAKSQYAYLHDVINHAEAYVKGRVHTNGIENFWSLLKRGIGGTYVAVEPFHLDRYVDEQVFRYNNRATTDNPMNDFDRFSLAVTNIVGKRLTYAELTGKEGETAF